MELCLESILADCHPWALVTGQQGPQLCPCGLSCASAVSLPRQGQPRQDLNPSCCRAPGAEGRREQGGKAPCASLAGSASQGAGLGEQVWGWELLTEGFGRG